MFTVEPKPVSSSISLTGELTTLATVHVTAPFAGIVKEVYFRYGQTVAKGTPLVRLDTGEVEAKTRDAESAYIKAAEKVREMESWDRGNEVAESRRNLTKAQMELDAQKHVVEETERLYKKGIVPGSEYDAAKRQYANAQMGFESAGQSMKTALAKGTGDNLHIARLELANARLKLEELQGQMSRATVVSPAAGTIILPEVSGGGSGDKKSKEVEKGVSVAQGDILVSIGDTGTLCVKTKVDEMSVTSIKKGQKVRVTGDAFPGVTLQGVVYHVSSQAVKSESGVASFEVTTVIDGLKGGEKSAVLLGMSTNLSIIFYEKPDALLVPIAAVQSDRDGPFVLVRRGEEKKKVTIKPGITTLDSVEVTGGLRAGDVIVF
jgi:multidrug efflux pump subunit AcrA (membrane-fusion protein)